MHLITLNAHFSSTVPTNPQQLSTSDTMGNALGPTWFGPMVGPAGGPIVGPKLHALGLAFVRFGPQFALLDRELLGRQHR
jgi:hypothetical protein